MSSVNTPRKSIKPRGWLHNYTIDHPDYSSGSSHAKQGMKAKVHCTFCFEKRVLDLKDADHREIASGTLLVARPEEFLWSAAGPSMYSIISAYQLL